jgi:hypothetical protein
MDSKNYTIGVRLQAMQSYEQALVLARLAQVRASDGQFAPKQLEKLFFDFALPEAGKISNIIAKLKGLEFLTKSARGGLWQMTPLGRQTSIELLSDMDFAAFTAESALSSSILGQIAHTVVPPTLAPPDLILSLQSFLKEHPFETNIFGMTRFADADGTNKKSDPINPALEIARNVCSLHGLQFHLASDRAMIDDLWKNVAAHMWASRYGIAFFENSRDEGLNYNLNIEVGSMLITGRRCALLKDKSVPKMPTDLVGQIYKDIDLKKPETVSNALHLWLRDDLNLGACPSCPKNKPSKKL